MREISFVLPCLFFILFLSFVSSFDVQNSILTDDFNTDLFQEEIVNHINANPEYGWTATLYPRFANYTIGDFKKLFGVKAMPVMNVSDEPLVVSDEASLKLPTEFDARNQWPKCTNIGKIRDQGHCGCCWAFGAIGSLSDRFCIHQGENVVLSVNEPLACCGTKCGDCRGGYPDGALNYARTSGVVTEECYPYFDKIGCPDLSKCKEQYKAPKCVKKCQGGKLGWEDSKHFGQSPYMLPFRNPTKMMEELYKNGPVSVSFDVYLDFATYKSGVYKHTMGPLLGYHQIKLIGWGTSPQGEDYWLLTNQWNVNWGEKGLVKFIRGKNDCGIENFVYASMPAVKRNVEDKEDEYIDGSKSVGYASV